MTRLHSPPSAPQLLHLSGVAWKSYLRLRRIFADRPGVRMTFDRTNLEITVPDLEHELPVDFLGFLVRLLALELSIPICGGGSVTMKYRKKMRGLEPDRCFWIANEATMRGVKKLDLRIHPPPDLAIEVDVSSSSIDRMSIYAKLGVPEVWRLSDGNLSFNVLQADGAYAEVTTSTSFPKVTPSDIKRFLDMTATMDQNAIVGQLREWIRGLDKPKPRQ